MLVTAFYTCYGLLYLEMKRLKYDTEIASDIIFWFGTHKEVQQSSDEKGIPCDIDLVNLTVQKNINL